MFRIGPVLAGFVAALFLWWGYVGQPASAQDSSVEVSTTPPPLEELRNPSKPLTPETVNALVSRLSDTEARALLLERLDAVAANDDQSGSMDIAGSMHSL